MNRIIAIDAGFTSCGWAVLEPGPVRPIALGCIRTEKSNRKGAVRVADDDIRRCQEVARVLSRTIRTHRVGGVIAELPSAGAKGARAITCMARAGAIVAVVAELWRLPTEWVTPGEIKLLTGSKAASKDEVEAVVLKRWPAMSAKLPRAKCEREHVADALAAFLAAEHGSLVRMLFGTR